MSDEPNYKLTVNKHGYDAQITIDGVLVDIIIARFGVTQFDAFMESYARLQDLPHRRALQTRKADGEEQEKHLVPRDATPDEQALAARVQAYRARLDDLQLRNSESVALHTMREMLADLEAVASRPKQEEAFVISDAEIARRRLAEMTPEERARHDAQKREDDLFVTLFARTVVTEYVRVRPGQIRLTDEATGEAIDLTTGEQLVEYFGSRTRLLVNLLHTVFVENTMTEALKNALRSRSASPRSSSAPEKAAVGPTPAPIAESVESSASAESVGVTESIEQIPSGSMTSSR